MNKVSLIVLVTWLKLCVSEQSSTNVSVELFKSGGRIVGGNVISLSVAPYQVSMQTKGKHECGGSIISPNFIITAAHCTYLARVKDVTIRLGTDKLESGGEIFKVKKIRSHPLFNPFTFKYDFAVLELTTKIVLKPGVKEIIELPEQDDPIADGTETLVSGWGETKNAEEPNNMLRGALISTVNQKKCKESYFVLTNQMVCAGDFKNGGKDSCQGDSGGPMKRLSDKKLIGIVSFGSGCAQPYYPGVYSKLSSVRNWINNNARLKNP